MFCFSDLYSQVFDPINPDEEHLKELVLQKINAKRAKRKAKYLVLNDALQQTADQYIETFRYYKFENTTENKERIDKKIKKVCQSKGYKNAFIDFHITSQRGLNYYGNEFYYDKEDAETTTHLFMGKRPTAKDRVAPDFKVFPLKTYTYEEVATLIARSFVKDDGYFVSLNNGYDKYGLALTVDKKTVLRNRIPRVKVILIVGGNRITW